MGALTLDASALIALLDRRDAHHDDAAATASRAAEEGRRLVAPASALSEALVAPARAGRAGDAVAALEAMGIEVASLDAEIAQLAAAFRATRTTLRLPDALILATAEHLGGDLLTYDERLRRLAA